MLTAIELGLKTLTAVTVKLNGHGPEIVQSGTAELGSVDADSIRAAIGKTGQVRARGELVVCGGEAETMIAGRGRMEISRTVPLEEGYSFQDIAQEIQRTLLSWSAKSAGREVGQIVLAGEGPEAAELAGAVGKLLHRDVVLV